MLQKMRHSPPGTFFISRPGLYKKINQHRFAVPHRHFQHGNSVFQNLFFVFHKMLSSNFVGKKINFLACLPRKYTRSSMRMPPVRGKYTPGSMLKTLPASNFSDDWEE